MSFLTRTSRLTTTIYRTTASSSTISTTLPSNPSAIYTSTLVRGFKNTTVNMGVHNVVNKTEFASAVKDNKIVVVDAFATWCGPCKVIAPEVVKFSDKFPSAHFIKLDVDEVPDVAQELGIRAMPTFLIFKNGEKVQEIVGANPKALLVAIEEATAE